MLVNLWKTMSARKLRAAADKLDPPLQASPVIVTDAERVALNAIANLHGVTSVETTFNGLAQIHSSPTGSFVLENELGAGLRAKGLISGAGQITLIGFKALQAPDYMPPAASLSSRAEVVL